MLQYPVSVRRNSEFIFYTGGMGEFDSRCASAVRLAKRQYPYLKIRLALVLPYMSNRLNTEKAYYEYYYDEIIIPEAMKLYAPSYGINAICIFTLFSAHNLLSQYAERRPYDIDFLHIKR